MINVNDLWEALNDLSAKGQSGHIGVSTFNRNLKRSILLLFDYYIEIVEQTTRAAEALRPFKKEIVIAVPSQYVDLPDDYGQIITPGFATSTGTAEDCANGNGSSIIFCPSAPMPGGAEFYVGKSGIRRASVSGGVFYHEIIADQLKVYPKDYVGTCRLKYYRKPIIASLVLTYNPTLDIAVYDPSLSTDSDFGEKEENQLLDLLLLFHGIAVKESVLISWVQAKKSLQSLPEIAVRQHTDRKF